MKIKSYSWSEYQAIKQAKWKIEKKLEAIKKAHNES